MNKYALVIHGGAGIILKENFTKEEEDKHLNKLKEVLEAGSKSLATGKSAMDVVEQAVVMLENTPLFNAGKGAVFTYEGKNEMDAAIMDGTSSEAGTIAGVSNIKNPVSAARAVIDKSDHVMLVGRGAEEFAKEKGLAIEKPEYFFDQQRWDQYQSIKESCKQQLDHAGKDGSVLNILENNKFGTVGAVALDIQANMATASSTGGITNKRYGRVGDSPIVGAGIFANEQCAISCTGHGEYFIKQVVAYDVAAQMKYQGISLKEAASSFFNKIEKLKGLGGYISVDKNANIEMPFNTPGMYRGFVSSEDSQTKAFMYGD